MIDSVEIDTIDGIIVASIGASNSTITIAVRDNGRGDAWVSLSPADALRLAAFLTDHAQVT